MDDQAVRTFRYNLLAILYGHNPAFEILLNTNPASSLLLVLTLIHYLRQTQVPLGHPHRESLDYVYQVTSTQFINLPRTQRNRDLAYFLLNGPHPPGFSPLFRDALTSVCATIQPH